MMLFKLGHFNVELSVDEEFDETFCSSVIVRTIRFEIAGVPFNSTSFYGSQYEYVFGSGKIKPTHSHIESMYAVAQLKLSNVLSEVRI